MPSALFVRVSSVDEICFFQKNNRIIFASLSDSPSTNLYLALTRMSDPIFLGIDKSSWDLFNGFANWASAAASFAAAFAALYIANRAAKPTAKLTVGYRISIRTDSTKPYPEYAVFRIVNTGDRPIRVVQIGWSIRWPHKRTAVQLFHESLSSPLPVDLSHGQEASWFIPLNALDPPWLERFSQKMLMPHYRLSLFSLRAQAVSSVGFEFSTKPEVTLLNHLRETCKRASKNANKLSN